ncbi:MAG: hypothetical protein ACR2IB_04535 [Pyrinomonadaceae bacterium]
MAITYGKMFAVSVMVLLACAPHIAQQDVLKKPFRQWTEVEVTKILNDSGWAKTQAIRVLRRKQMRSVAGQVSEVPTASSPARQAPLGGAEDAVDYRFTLRLRSARPIREAIVRLVHIESKYDQMPPEQQKSIDEQTMELLECRECRHNYIVSVGFGSLNSENVDLVYDWFRGQTVASLKGYISLANELGQRRNLINFIPPKVPGDEAFFFFARLDEDGNPLVTSRNKKLLFRMSDKNASSITNFNMDITKMILDDKLEF